jgi:hypothetical protein
MRNGLTPGVVISKQYFRSSSLFSMEYGAHQSTKPQAPSPKLQCAALDGHYIPRALVGSLGFGAFLVLGAWRLGFEASQATYSTENSEEPL